MKTWTIDFLDGTTGKVTKWQVSGGPDSFSTRTKIETWLTLHFGTRFDMFFVDEVRATRVGKDWTFSLRVRDAFGNFPGCGIVMESPE